MNIDKLPPVLYHGTVVYEKGFLGFRRRVNFAGKPFDIDERGIYIPTGYVSVSSNWKESIWYTIPKTSRFRPMMLAIYEIVPEDGGNVRVKRLDTEYRVYPGVPRSWLRGKYTANVSNLDWSNPSSAVILEDQLSEVPLHENGFFSYNPMNRHSISS